MKHVFKTLLVTSIVILLMISGKKDALAQSSQQLFSCLISSESTVIPPSRLYMLVTTTPGEGYVALTDIHFWITEEPGGVPTFSYGATLQDIPGSGIIIVPAGPAATVTLHAVSSGNMHGIDVPLYTISGAGGLTTLGLIDAIHVY